MEKVVTFDLNQFDSDDDEPPIEVVDDEALGVYKVILPETWERDSDVEEEDESEEEESEEEESEEE